MNRFSLLFYCMLFIGCRTIKLPLCERLSVNNPSPIKLINKQCYDVCKRKHIKIDVLNSNVASFSGSKLNINWLESNYIHLLCNYNQNNVDPSFSICQTFTKNYKKWVNKLNTKKFNQDSLLSFYSDKNYCNNCVLRSGCH